ncbi:MAG TPA: MarR family winged helix-turn-helix transcriptional regulator [Candidatus Acidoferrum sp.]|nr:MarR family winged helix-turn-helix transcriptional regulator [Candidatus Acidoferrum sp.]
MHVKKSFRRPDPAPTLDLSGTGFCASFNFRRTARAVTRLYDLALQSSGIRSTQFGILVAVAKSQPVSIGHLARTLGTVSTTLSRSLALLQREGLLFISGRSTKRQRFLTLTPAGEKALARALPEWRKIQERFVNAVGSDFWLAFRNELERLSSVAIELEHPAPQSSRSLSKD